MVTIRFIPFRRTPYIVPESILVLVKYIFPAIFYFLWINSIVWTGHIWTSRQLGGEYIVLNYTLFSISHALGILSAGLFLYRKPVDVFSGEYVKLIFIAAALTFLSSTLQTIALSWLLPAVNMLVGFCGGLYLLLLHFYLYKYIPNWKRGTCLGIACAAGTFINYLLYVILFPQYNGFLLYAKTIFAAILPLIGALLFHLIKAGNPPQEKPESHEKLKHAKTSVSSNKITELSGIKYSFYIISFIICLFFYFVVGIQDGVASFEWFKGTNFVLHSRIMYILAAVVGGIICDRKGRHTVLLVSISLMTAGCISMIYSYDSIPAFIFLMCIMAGLVAFDLFIRLIFTDTAVNSKYAPIVCGLGFVLGYTIRPLGIKFSEVVVNFNIQTLFVTGILISLAMIPMAGVLLDILRGIYVHTFTARDKIVLTDPSDEKSAGILPQSPKPESIAFVETQDETAGERFISRYGLTKREARVLTCILTGCSVSDMSRLLFISESTVKFHVGNILKKSKTKNRMELLLLFTGANEKAV